MTLTFAALVPGLPHLLKPTLGSPHAQLHQAMRRLGDDVARSGVQRVIYYSSQWLSVLGTMVQAKPRLEGVHVDPSWHDLGSFAFGINVASNFSERLAHATRSAGFVTQTVAYDGFPVDTGTIVADTLINQARVDVSMISSWLYADYHQTKLLAASLVTALNEDPTPTAVIGITSLSGNYFPTPCDPREDHIANDIDDTWNRRVIGLCKLGHFGEIDDLAAAYARTCRVDIDFKVMAFLRGIGAAKEGKPATLHEYQAICGTGAAVLQF